MLIPISLCAESTKIAFELYTKAMLFHTKRSTNLCLKQICNRLQNLNLAVWFPFDSNNCFDLVGPVALLPCLHKNWCSLDKKTLEADEAHSLWHRHPVKIPSNRTSRPAKPNMSFNGASESWMQGWWSWRETFMSGGAPWAVAVWSITIGKEWQLEGLFHALKTYKTENQTAIGCAACAFGQRNDLNVVGVIVQSYFPEGHNTTARCFGQSFWTVFPHDEGVVFVLCFFGGAGLVQT